MDGLSIILFLLIMVGFGAAIRSIWRKRDNPCGGCSGSCSSCSVSDPDQKAKRKNR